MKKTRNVFSALVGGVLLNVVNVSAASAPNDSIRGIVVDSISGAAVSSVKITGEMTGAPNCSTYSDAYGKFALGFKIPASLRPMIIGKAAAQYQEKIYSLNGSVICGNFLSPGVYLKMITVNGQKKFHKVMNSESSELHSQQTVDKAKALGKIKQLMCKLIFQKVGYFLDSSTAYVGQSGLIDSIVPITCPGNGVIGSLSQTPTIQFVGLQNGASMIYGKVNNVNAKTAKVVMWALTNQFYIQPAIAWPYTKICGDGNWSNSTYPWSSLVALVVDSATYYTGATRITHPAIDPGVLAWTEFPLSRSDIPINWCGYQWGVKEAANPFDPGPNYWSASVNNIWVDSIGLHLKTILTNSKWTCSEIYLTKSLGFGIYTYKLASRVDSLDSNTVFSGFLYEGTNKEIDIEFSKAEANPNNMQYVVQPYTIAGNMLRFKMPAAIHSTHQIEWHSDRIIFKSWRGWSDTLIADSAINSWTYTGANIPPAENHELFHFNNWLYGGVAPVSGKGDEVIVKSFAFSKRATYAVLINTPNGNVVLSPAQATYDSGSVITLTATPSNNYKFISWSGDLISTVNPVQIVVNSAKTIMANYGPIPSYVLTISAVNGTVTSSPASAKYDSNATVILTAIPSAGYKFTGWSGSLNGSANPDTIKMNSVKNITANFTASSFMLTINATNGSVAKSPNQNLFDSSAIDTLTATPSAHFRFTGWSGDLSGSANPAIITMNSSKNITANFIAIPAYTISITGTNGSGTITFSPLNNAPYDSNTVVTLTAAPSTGYKFFAWGGDLVSSANPATITVNSSKNITVSFAPIVTYTLTATATNGSVAMSPSLASYDSGAIVTLTAIPANGYYQFGSWSGDFTGSTNPAQITMNATKNITANFNQVLLGDTTLPKTITFTTMPLIGSAGNLTGRVSNLSPIGYSLVVYINVAGTWWIKPYWASPVTTINYDGSWSCNVVTGGNDAYATEYRAYIIPAGYTPPSDMGSLPANEIFATRDTVRQQ